MNRSWKIFSAFYSVFVCLVAAAPASAGVAAEHTRIVPRGVLGAVHADVTTIDAKGQTRRYTWDKGRVTAKSETSITIARRDGKSVSLPLGREIRVHAKNGTVNVGDFVIAYSREGAAYLVLAFQTREGPPPITTTDPAVRDRRDREFPLREQAFEFPRRFVHVDWALLLADGKAVAIAYDRGLVTAKTDSSITLKRPDGKSVTLKVGGGTKILKDGVKVGDQAIVLSRDGTALNVISGEKTRR